MPDPPGNPNLCYLVISPDPHNSGDYQVVRLRMAFREQKNLGRLSLRSVMAAQDTF